MPKGRKPRLLQNSNWIDLLHMYCSSRISTRALQIEGPWAESRLFHPCSSFDDIQYIPELWLCLALASFSSASGIFTWIGAFEQSTKRPDRELFAPWRCRHRSSSTLKNFCHQEIRGTRCFRCSGLGSCVLTALSSYHYIRVRWYSFAKWLSILLWKTAPPLALHSFRCRCHTLWIFDQELSQHSYRSWRRSWTLCHIWKRISLAWTES